MSGPYYGATIAKFIQSKANGGDGLAPNPRFVFNGHEDKDTSEYLKHRNYVRYAGKGVGLVGSATSLFRICAPG